MSEKFRYKKEMGQHFLYDRELIERLADASLVTKEDGVLEIGPGKGTLTGALAMRARQVIAVELDRTLLRGLEVSLAMYPNVRVEQGDILKKDIAALAEELGMPCRVAANLPYNITTPLLERLLLERLPFASMAIMVQREVGLRMTARAGEAGYGPFSLLVQYFAEPREAVAVPAACFTPPPKVDSSFMLLLMRESPPVQVAERAFFALIRAAFAMRRKTLANNLVSAYHISREQAISALEGAGIAPFARAEDVDMEGFARLSRAL